MIRKRQELKLFTICSNAILAVVLLAGSSVAAEKIRIGYTSPTPNQSVLWVAEASGLLKKNGVEQELIYMPGNISLPSLLSGEIQFGQMTGALMAPGRMQGGDPVMLLSVQDYLDDRFVVSPNIKSAEELKGKRIGISRFGAASHMRVLNILPRYVLAIKILRSYRSATRRRESSRSSATRSTLRAFRRRIILPPLRLG